MYEMHRPLCSISNIRSKYNAGTPFSTRASLQGLVQQLEAFEKRSTISIQALDGSMVAFDIE